MHALLLSDAPSQVVRACRASGFSVARVKTVRDGRTLLARREYALVDGRIAKPRPLEEEMRQRLELFFEALKGHSAAHLYEAVLREVERPLVAMALQRANGVRSTAAQELGIDRGTLARRVRALGLQGKGAEARR
jgi:Fis family transcriptional regulator